MLHPLVFVSIAGPVVELVLLVDELVEVVAQVEEVAQVEALVGLVAWVGVAARLEAMAMYKPGNNYRESIPRRRVGSVPHSHQGQTPPKLLRSIQEKHIYTLVHTLRKLCQCFLHHIGDPVMVMLVVAVA